MVDTLTGKSPEKLEEIFSTYSDLVKRQRSLEERLQKAEKEKGSVDERIYDKVISGYKQDLESVRSDLAPVQNEINEMRRAIQAQLEALVPQIKSLEDELAELGFRHRVGEFGGVEYEDKKKRIDERMQELSLKQNEIQQKIEAFNLDRDTREQNEAETHPHGHPAAPQTSAAPEVSARRDEVSELRLSEMSAISPSTMPGRMRLSPPISKAIGLSDAMRSASGGIRPASATNRLAFPVSRIPTPG